MKRLKEALRVSGAQERTDLSMGKHMKEAFIPACIAALGTCLGLFLLSLIFHVVGVMMYVK